MGVIFMVSSIPGSSLPGGYSVQGHLAEYALLGALLTLALPDRSPVAPWAFAALALGSLYGVSDELHQWFVPGRVPDVLDWTADTVGAAVGVSAVIGVRARLAQRSARTTLGRSR